MAAVATGEDDVVVGLEDGVADAARYRRPARTIRSMTVRLPICVLDGLDGPARSRPTPDRRAPGISDRSRFSVFGGSPPASSASSFAASAFRSTPISFGATNGT